MAHPLHHTALALAHALLAGPRTVAGLAARAGACLGTAEAWQHTLAERCARLPGEHWQRLSPRLLAAWLLHDAGLQQAWAAAQARGQPLAVRRWLLRVATAQQPLPLGLHQCQVPYWPQPAALATWLGLSGGGLWRLARPAAWQRRLPLGEQPHHARLLAKRSGGWRLLEVPQPWLMALQRRVLHDLLAHLPPHEAACAWVPGRGLLQHAHAHAGQAVVLRFDLQDFFVTVRAARVHALFARLGYAAPVARALTALCTTATPEPVLQRLRQDGGLSWQQAQRLRSAHLPQGAPTSPALANLCAFGLDLRLAGLAQQLGATYTRYGDDLVLSGGPALQAARHRVTAWVAAIAHDEGFSLNLRKTRCLPQHRRQTVCGVVVNQRPNLRRDELDRLKAVLHACVRDGPQAHNRDGHADWRGHLQGRVAWVRQLNPARGQRLQALLARIDWSR